MPSLIYLMLPIRPPREMAKCLICDHLYSQAGTVKKFFFLLLELITGLFEPLQLCIVVPLDGRAVTEKLSKLASETGSSRSVLEATPGQVVNCPGVKFMVAGHYQT